jgi:tetratricopeptide (TPR) repeat protein
MTTSDASKAQALFRNGMALHAKGQLKQARAFYEQSLRLDPKNSDALHFLGVIFFQTMNPRDAAEFIGKAIQLNPNNAIAHYNCGLALQQLKRPEAAIASYNRAIQLMPNHIEAYSNRGNALRELGQLDSAIASYDRAIELQPNYAEAYSNRGLALQELKQLDAAIASYDRAIQLAPDLAETHYNCGNALQELGRMEAALASYDRAIKLKPDFAEPYCNRGNALQELNQLNAAVASYDRAIELKPDYAEAFSNRGNALKELKQLDAALANYERAIQLAPDYAEAHFNQSVALLLTGNFALGWKKYEWRWKKANTIPLRRDFRQPIWLGRESLRDKTILLHSEQGLGDTIQFCRYANLVRDLGARVILELPKSLIELLTPLQGVAEFVAHGTTPPAFDYHCPLLSLPLALKTDIENIPNCTPYLFGDRERTARWKRYLGDTGFLIGINWQGNRKSSIDPGRSFPLALYYAISQIPNVRLISLQKNDGLEQLLDIPADMRVEILEDSFDAGENSFLDSAAVIRNLDLVITPDTAIAHLSGALGCPTWIALKHVPDWRWMLEGRASPWYPTVSLFRQETKDNWEEPFARIHAELLNLIANRHLKRSQTA